MKISSIAVRTLVAGLALGVSLGVQVNPAWAAPTFESSNTPPPPPPPPPLVDTEEPAANEDSDSVGTELPDTSASTPAHEQVIAPVIRKPQKKKSTLGVESSQSAPTMKEVLYLEQTSNPLGHGFFWSGLGLALAGGGAITWAMLSQRDKLHDGVVRSGTQNNSYLKQAQALTLGGEIAVITGGVLMALGTTFWLTNVGETTSQVLPDQVWVFPGADKMFAGVSYDF